MQNAEYRRQKSESQNSKLQTSRPNANSERWTATLRDHHGHRAMLLSVLGKEASGVSRLFMTFCAAKFCSGRLHSSRKHSLLFRSTKP